jgi:hypothetical protein
MELKDLILHSPGLLRLLVEVLDVQDHQVSADLVDQVVVAEEEVVFLVDLELLVKEMLGVFQRLTLVAMLVAVVAALLL